MERGRRIAFDYGDVRIGVAASDADGILASPLTVLQSHDRELFKKISALFQEIDPVVIYVGLPVNMSGSESESSKKARSFATELEKLTNARISLVDERLSTVSAQAKARAVGKTVRQSKENIDALAAVEILEAGLSHDRSQ
ncbi:MAG: hypothetical protein RL466_546 [Actinomycetota bacterium]|jgi:putative Holliday junction resolvase